MTTLPEQIDLRDYVRVLIRHRYWIIGSVVVVAVLTLAVGFLQPSVYSATATVVVTGARIRVQLDSRMQDTTFNPRTVAAGYPALAEGDDLLVVLLDDINAHRPADAVALNLDELKILVSAGDAGDPSIVRLGVSYGDPAEAARAANRWAELFVDHLQDLFGGISDLSLLEQQAREAQTVLERADETLTALRRDYGLGYSRSVEGSVLPDSTLTLGITYRLQARTGWLGSYERRAEQIAQLLAEAHGLSAHVDGASPVLVTGLLADLTNLGLLDTTTAGPLVQFNLNELDPVASLTALIYALEAKQAATNEAIVRLKQEVADLQAEMATRQLELERLERERQVAQDAYVTLTNRVQALKLETNEVARIASRAAVPGQPAKQHPFRDVALAGVVALLVSAAGVLLKVSWWRPGSRPAGPPPSVDD